MILIVLLAVLLVVAGVGLIYKLPKTPKYILVIFLLAVFTGALLLWLIWLGIMVFGVGPSLKSK